MKVLSVIGARPQFVKAAVVSQAIAQHGITEILVHTGQHFDANMSDAFFADLDLPTPHYNLDIHSLSHGAMTGRMMEALETIMQKEQPDWLLVYGDTNSTLAAALAAAKLHIPIAHVEAGLRSYNRAMPEEINRIVTDQLSTLLFVPTPLATHCLAKEGITQGVHLIGDVMADAVMQYQAKAEAQSQVLARNALQPGGYYLATIHRPSNTDDAGTLAAILQAFTTLDAPVVLPLHPRTKSRIKTFDLRGYLAHPNIKVIPPASYLDMLMLEKHCRAVVTDSGGIQKEAYLSRQPCFTLRPETEWKETVEAGWNRLVTAVGLRDAIAQFQPPTAWPTLYGDGKAAHKVARLLLSSPK
ncbi:MAG: UDP-N-acetylglucosamine 2-epimerase (non-hydrolyzing) [Phormidesmis sp.]